MLNFMQQCMTSHIIHDGKNGTTLTLTYLFWHDKIKVRCLLRTMTSGVYYKASHTSKMFSTMARLSSSCEFNCQNTWKCGSLHWSLSKHLKVWSAQLVVVVSHSNYECGCIDQLHKNSVSHSSNHYREQTIYVYYFWNFRTSQPPVSNWVRNYIIITMSWFVNFVASCITSAQHK